jgi:asparagine synthase (glutamine-hydrolysing)
MKNVFIKLSGSDWQNTRNAAIQEVWVKGSPYVGNQRQTAAMLAESVPHPFGNAPSLEQLMLHYNGFYAMVCQQSEQLLAGVDRLRSIPLFYSLIKGRLYLSDDAEWVRLQAGDHVVDPLAWEEFQLAGFVTGPDTLFPHVKQLQAGECLLALQGKEGVQLQRHRYYRFMYTEPKQYDEAALLQELDQATTNSVQRLIDYAAGRQITVPLSGGYDSRLIVSQLKRLGYDNVLTFTYGLAGNKEARYSKKVADSLRLKWHFVEYTPKLWRDAWPDDDHWAYHKWASGWTSLAHTQDWLAVKVMKQQRILSPDTVFVPGHIARYGVPRWMEPEQSATSEMMAEAIFSQHYYLAPTRLESTRPVANWQERVLRLAEKNTVQAAKDLMIGAIKFNWQERQAKYIVNSVRVYEFFGYKWWLPLWENEFLEYWQRTPFLVRQKDEFYYDYVNQVCSEQAGVPDLNTLGNGRDWFIKKMLLRLPFAHTKLAEAAWYKAHALVAPKAKRRINLLAAESGIPEADHENYVKRGYTPLGVRAHYFLQKCASYAGQVAAS